MIGILIVVFLRLFSYHVDGRLKGGKRRCEETMEGYGIVQDDSSPDQNGDEGDGTIVVNLRNIQTLQSTRHGQFSCYWR